MKLELASTTGGNRIDGYDARGIRINGRLCTGAVLLTPTWLETDFPLNSLASLDAATLAGILTLAPALLLIGTGATHRFPPSAALVPLMQRGIGVEVMSTPAACRSHAVLVDEGREVVALLLPPAHEE